MIYSKSRTRVQQPQSKLVKLGIYAQQLPFIGSAISHHVTKYCDRFHDKKNSRERIQKFAKTYNIQPKSIRKCKDIIHPEDCWDKFETLNDFFIRHRIGLPKVSMIRTQIVSPADCYSVFLTKPQTWIKGTQFTISRLLFGRNNIEEQEYYNTMMNLIIFRLAPHHYHRFHCPVFGKVLQMSVFGTKYNSVDPIVVRSLKNVYTTNVRMVLKIRNPYFGDVFVAIIGATCVGSIVINHPRILKTLGLDSNQKITDRDIRQQSGHTFYFNNENAPVILVNEELGYFQYGGSTIVVGYWREDTKLQQIGEILLDHSIQNIETEIHVGDSIVQSIRKK